MQSEQVGRLSSKSIPIFQPQKRDSINDDEDPLKTITQQVFGENSSQAKSSESSSSYGSHNLNGTNSSSSLPKKTKIKHTSIADISFDEPLDCIESSCQKNLSNNFQLKKVEENNSISSEDEFNRPQKEKGINEIFSKVNRKNSKEMVQTSEPLMEEIDGDSKIKTSKNFFGEMPKILIRKTSTPRITSSSKITIEQKPQENSPSSREPSPRVSFLECAEDKSILPIFTAKNKSSISPKCLNEYPLKKIEKKNLCQNQKVQFDITECIQISNVSERYSNKFADLCEDIKKMSMFEYHFSLGKNSDVYFDNFNKLSDMDLVNLAWEKFVFKIKELPDRILVNNLHFSFLEQSSCILTSMNFWNLLFNSFYLYGYDYIDSQEVNMHANKEAALMVLYRGSEVEIKDLICDVPCFNVINLMLKSSDELDDSLFKLLFPDLFSEGNLFSVQYVPRIFEYCVNIQGGCKVEVEKVKKIDIMMDEVNKIATITYTTLEGLPHNDLNQKYAIKNINCDVHNNKHWEKVMSILTNPLEVSFCEKEFMYST